MPGAGRPSITDVRKALVFLLTLCALWLGPPASAAVTWNALTSSTTAQPSVAGGLSVTCTLGSAACPLAGGTIAAGNIIALCMHIDSGAGTQSVADTAGDTWSRGPDNSNFGNAETSCFWTITKGLVSTNTIVWTTTGGGVFATMDLAYLSGLTVATPTLDRSSSANFGSNVTSSPSGSVTGSQPHDAVFGAASNKFGGVAMAQPAPFSSPPGQPSGGNSGYVAGTAIDAAGSASAFNYAPTSTAQSPTSSVIMLFTTEPPPFNRLGANLLGLQPVAVSNPANNCAAAPATAQANGLCTETYGVQHWIGPPAVPATMDYGQSYGGGFPSYFDNTLSQGCTPSNTTLNGNSVVVGECNGNYQATIGSFGVAPSGGVNYVGKAIGNHPGGLVYVVSSCAYNVQNAANGQWEACLWGFTAECMTPTTMAGCNYPGIAGAQYAGEPDVHEGFDGNFGALGNQYCATTHIHPRGSATFADSQDQHCFTKTNAFFASQHTYGLLWKAAAESATVVGASNGSKCYYLDEVQQACTTYQLFAHNVTAGASFSTSSPTITLSATPTAVLQRGFVIADTPVACNPGTISSIAGPVITLTTNAACNSSGSADALVIAPPQPCNISSGAYVSSTGVATVTNGCLSGLLPGETVYFAPNNAGPNLSGVFQTIAGTSGATIVLQLPGGLGNATITGGVALPSWMYGADDIQHYDILFGCMNGAGACTVPAGYPQVWQLNDNDNLTLH